MSAVTSIFSTIRDIWLPELKVLQKFTKLLPKIQKPETENRDILRSFGRIFFCADIFFLNSINPI
jgi:hypothetical protein